MPDVQINVQTSDALVLPNGVYGDMWIGKNGGLFAADENGIAVAASTHTLLHTHTATTHTLVGTMPTTGLVSATFKATSDFTEGNTFSINGTAYTAKPNGEEQTLPDKAFVLGDVVSVAVDVVGKKINFRLGGGGYSGNSTLPSQIKNFTGQPKDKQIQLTWTNPPTDFAGLIITRKAGSMPNSIGDGVKLQCGTATSYLDTGLTNGTTYYHRAFPYNSKKQFQTELEDGVFQTKAGSFPANIADATWEDIDRAVALGLIPNTWTVGSEKDITLTTGEVLTLQIYDLYHDDLTSGGKAGITFGLKNLMGVSKRMNGTKTNAGGFFVAELYYWMQSTLYNSLPADLKSSIKAVIKKTAIGGRPTSVVGESMKVFLFAEFEVSETNFVSAYGEGTKYPLFASGANQSTSRVKKKSNGVGISSGWWLRSPLASNNHPPNSTTFCAVLLSGSISNASGADFELDICFGFCV